MRPHEHAQHPLPQSDRAGAEPHPQCRPDRGSGVPDLWNTVNQWIDNGEEHGHGLREVADQAGHQADHHHERRAQHQVELPGLPALPGHRHRHGGRRGDLAAVPDRGGEVGDPERQEGRLREARRGLEEGLPDRPASVSARLRRSAGMRARSPRPASTPRSTRREGRGLGAGHVDRHTSGWPERMFKMDKHYRWLGGSGASGHGYGLPASIGAAHANKALGRFSVSIQGDGDMMYAPGALWTAAHHDIPLLTVDAQQPRLPSGGHARAAPVQPAQPRRVNLGKTAGRSAPASKTRTSTTQVSRSRWAGGRRARSTIRRISGRRSSKPSQVVKSGQPALIDFVTQPR